MADQKISALPAAAALSGAEIMPAVQGGATVRTTAQEVANLAPAPAWASITSKPTTLAGYGISDPIVLTSGSYSDPAWIVSLSWSKIASHPTTLSGYGITDAVNGTTTQMANQVFAGPASGSAAAPTFRALVAADLPAVAVQNPMTAAGDLIAAGAAGTPQRLAAGTAGQVLTIVSGVPAWAAAYTNPMTTSGDIVIGGASGAAGRLGVGTAGQVLGVVSGAPAWTTLPASFGNPMTVAGDLIAGGAAGAASRLAVGTAGQVLTVVSGVPAWASLPAASTTRIIPLLSGIASTKYGSASKFSLGAISFDPSAVRWALTATSTATLYMLLETTSGSNAACGELFQQTGTGAPAVVAATPTTANTSATLVSVDVSTAFRPGAPAGIFLARAWITTPNTIDQATCSGAWLEIQP